MSHVHALDNKQTLGLHLVGLRKRRLFWLICVSKARSFDRLVVVLRFFDHLICCLLEVSQRAHHVLQTT